MCSTIIVHQRGRLWVCSSGEGKRQQMSFCGKDVVLHIKKQILLLSKQQEQVLKHLRQEKRVHAETGGWG